MLVKDKTKKIYDLDIGPWMAIFINREGMEMGTAFNIIKAFGSASNFYTLLLRYLAPGYNPTVELQLFQDITKDIFKWCGSDVIRFYNKETFVAINFLDDNWKEIKDRDKSEVSNVGKVFKMNYDGEDIKTIEIPSTSKIKKLVTKNPPQESWVKEISTNYKTTGSIIKLEEEYHYTRKPEPPPKGLWERFQDWYFGKGKDASCCDNQERE
jgi:hypothetical protein